MEPVWLIEANAFGTSFEPVRAAIRRHGMAWALVQPGPFLRGAAPEVNGVPLGADECVVFCGTWPVWRHIQLHQRWRPGGWCTTERFECAAYYPRFAPCLLNARHAIVPVEEALTDHAALFDRFAVGERVFVRPGGVQKTFTGRCASREGFAQVLGAARYAGGSVLVAPPREIDREWRLVVRGGEVVAASRYLREGQLDVEAGCPAEVLAFARGALAQTDWRPDPIFMLDVCAAEGQLYVLELNSFSCSGWYRCDPSAVVSAARELALAAWQRGA